MSQLDPTTERRKTQDAIFADINGVLATTSKWLIASLGAIGAVLVAGSQLSDMGSLPIGPRFGTAVVGAGLGLLCVLVAIWLVARLLAPERYYISDLATEWTRYEELAREKGGKRAARQYPVSAWFADHVDYLAGYDSPKQVYDEWKSNEKRIKSRRNSRKEKELLGSKSARILDAINGVVAMANYQRNRTNFRRMQIPLVVLMMLAAVAIGVFAWAANPAEKGPASLRNADLQGADLTGVFLGYADLSGLFTIQGVGEV